MIRSICLASIIPLVLLGCNTTGADSEGSDQVSKLSETAARRPPSTAVEGGSCMADTLSFLVGQPETALQAMQYPENTRILVHGQVVNSVIDPSRLNLVIGLDRNIRFVYCG